MSFNPDEYLEKFGGDVKAALSALANDRLRATKTKNAVLEAFGVNIEDSEDTESVKKRLGAELKSYRDLGKPEDIATRLTVGSSALEAFKGLESDPAKLSELMKTLPKRLVTAESELGEVKRSGLVRDAAESYGFKPSVLQRLLKADALEIAFDAEAERDVQLENGKRDRVKGSATLTIDGKPVDLAAHAASVWGDMLPALTDTTGTRGRTQNQTLPGGSGSKPPAELGSDKSVTELAAQERSSNPRYRG